MDQENPQLNIQLPSRSPHLTAILIGAVVIAVIVGSGIYWYQNIKFEKEDDGGNFTQEQIVGDYQWTDTILRSQYSKVLWNKITTPKLAGFSPNTSLTEKKTEGCGNIYTDSYLHIEGGLCGVGYWLEDPSGMRIDSKEKLAARFVPIENEAEAVSFAANTQGGLKIDASGVPEGHTLAISDGFLVQLVYRNAYGCGSHEPTGVIFKISKNGEVRQIASEKQNPSKPGEPVLCVD